MKKRAKKLTLSRETLHRLQLTGVAGGGNTYEINTGCACTDGCGGTGGGGTGGGGTGGGGSAGACTTGRTYEILSGCATNCG